MNKSIRLLLLSVGMIILGACGGGGGGGGSAASVPVKSTTSFPVAQAMANFVSTSHNINYAMTGKENGIAVTGSGTISFSAAVSTTFEGQTALSQTGTISGTISGNGNTVPYAFTGQDIYTTNYDYLGVIDSGSYCVGQGSQPFPSSAKVGDTAFLGTSDCYQDSSKNVKTETDKDSYVIEADTSTTAIFNQITSTYDLSNQLTSTTQVRWRIDQVGNITFVSLTGTDYTTSPAGVLTFTAH